MDEIERKIDFYSQNNIKNLQINILNHTISKLKCKFNLNYLEVGVGNGGLNKYIFNNLHPKHVSAIDFSQECLNCLNKDVKKIHFDMDQTKSFDISELEDDFYDIILIFDVLEHLRWPRLTLEVLSNKLKRDGILIASTPNINWYGYRLSFLFGNDVEHFHNTNHVRYWNLLSFRKLFSEKFTVLNQYTDIKICKPFSYFLFKKRYLYSKIKFNSKFFGDNQIIVCKIK